MDDPAATARALRQAVDVRVLEMLVCPLTKTRLVLSDDGTELVSVAARLAFPIRDGVPMLALDEAREIDPDELRARLPRLGGAAEDGRDDAP
ncbi:MAG TPA: Trm112 family protein [Alphaproteobacteria bacterium]|nr:Trm112 family protein [Alphaproteobacteria bacterium]